MSNIAILHFSPLELYPPVLNLLELIAQKKSFHNTTVISSNTIVDSLKKYQYRADNIQILRFASSGQQLGIIKRYWSYIYYNLASLFYLIILRPRALIYYESISSFPAYLYKRLINHRVRIFIHYHEYTSPQEYKNGMKLIRFFHKYEKWLYTKAEWVSHTNEYRMQLFLNDIYPLKIQYPHLMPNYPPKSWSIPFKVNNTSLIRVVYVGAMSLDTMFLKEFTEWIIAQNGKIVLDIYSFNITKDAKEYLVSQNTEWINLKSGLHYFDLPKILINYSVGVVLYKGHIPNYIYNAPNKLFEYLVCGLDVWIPKGMKGSMSYVTAKSYPKVIAIDFLHLEELNLNSIIDHNNCSYQPLTLYCEDIYNPFIKKLFDE